MRRKDELNVSTFAKCQLVPPGSHHYVIINSAILVR